MKKIDWQGFKKIMGAFTWVSVTVMLLYHIHQAISQARSTANRRNEGLVSSRLIMTQETALIPFYINKNFKNNELKV